MSDYFWINLFGELIKIEVLIIGLVYMYKLGIKKGKEE